LRYLGLDISVVVGYVVRLQFEAALNMWNLGTRKADARERGSLARYLSMPKVERERRWVGKWKTARGGPSIY
jgi:hypothetical protein